MAILYFVLTLAWIVSESAVQSAKIFQEHNLFEKKWHYYRLGFSVKEMKKAISKTDDVLVKEKLRKAIKLSKISSLFLKGLLGVFATHMVVNMVRGTN